MNLSHYFYLYPAYGIAILGWILYKKFYKNPTNEKIKEFALKKPWLEFIYALLAAVATILIGQLYLKGVLTPKIAGLTFVTEAINQVLIFSPFFLLLILRKQPLTTAWIPKKDKWVSILIGFVLAILALTTFLVLKGRTNILEEIFAIYHYINLPQMVQVFAEDFAISVCLFRLIGWIGYKKAILLIAILFAVAHIPAMISNGIALENFSSLILDSLLAVFVLHALYRSKNFLWFWMIHYAMDMTQFINP